MCPLFLFFEKHTCGPCALCKQESKRYTHAEKMNPGVFKLITEKENIKKDACICHACYKHVAQNIKNYNYQPQWKLKPPICRVSCGVLTCHKEVYRHTSIASPSLIESLLSEKLCTLTLHSANPITIKSIVVFMVLSIVILVNQSLKKEVNYTTGTVQQ